MRTNKKAQLTAFIIIALVLLISIGLYFGIREFSARNQPDVPQPVESDQAEIATKFVESCMNRVGKEAVILIGEQGGYLNTEGLKVSPIPYDSDVFYNDVYNIPYWYYMKSEGVFRSNKPALCSYSGDCGINDFRNEGQQSVQENIEIYIKENIDSCINDFKDLDPMFETNIIGEKNLGVQIFEDQVIIRMNYPIEINSYDSESTTGLNTFSTELDVPLLQLFSFAKDIIEAEIAHKFIESNTLNLISVYSRMDNNYLPPMAEMTFFKYDSNFWIRRQLAETMRYEVLPFVGLTKIGNAKYGIPAIARVKGEYFPFAQGLYDSFVVDIGNNKTYNYTADIYYPDSEIDFFINKGEEIIRPSKIKGIHPTFDKMFSLLIQDYSFNYHLSFPVVITLKDDEAFNGQGYEFTFAVESNIRNNVPAVGNISFTSFGSTSRLQIDDPNALVNKIFTIKVKDKHTDMPVIDADIIYNCGTDFYVGKTEIKNNEGVFEGKLPYCGANGYLKIIKDGYGPTAIDLINDEIDISEETIDFEIWPIANKTVRYYKRTPEDIENMSTIEDKLTKKHEIDYDEEIIFNFQRIKSHPSEDPFPLTGFKLVTRENYTNIETGVEDQRAQIELYYNSGQMNQSVYESLIEQLDIFGEENVGVEVAPTEELELIPGTYVIDALMIKNGPFNIPEKDKEICPSGFDPLGICIGGTETITYNETNLTSWVTGKLKFNFTIRENYVYNDKNLYFFIPVVDVPTNWDQLIDFDIDSYLEDEVEDWMMLPYYE